MNPWRWVDPRIDAVRLADVRAYFLGRSWAPRPNPNPRLLRFEAPSEGDEPPVFQMVSASEQAADYRQRLIELITTLSGLEDRHPVAVLEEMLTAGRSQADGNGPERGGRAEVGRG